MKPLVLVLLAAALTASANTQAQTSAAPAAPSSQPSATAHKTVAPAAKTAVAATPGAKPAASIPAWIKLPPGVPRLAHGPLQTPLSLHYEDIKVGAGALGESGKMWHIKYTGWRAADGIKFDSWDDHKQPLMGKDGKPELGDDGKPKMKDPEPMAFPQGMGRVIPGFDYALDGMKIGGKRRIFIPWQMAYGTRNIPDRPDHPGIPAKSDLIFDVELVEVTDMPAPTPRPGMPGGVHPMPVPPHPGVGSQPGAAPAHPSAPATGVPGSAPASPDAAAPGAASAPATQPAAQPANPQPAAPPQPTTPPQSTTPPAPK